jgi:hypothetical protein
MRRACERARLAFADNEAVGRIGGYFEPRRFSVPNVVHMDAAVPGLVETPFPAVEIANAMERAPVVAGHVFGAGRLIEPPYKRRCAPMVTVYAACIANNFAASGKESVQGCAACLKIV